MRRLHRHALAAAAFAAALTACGEEPRDPTPVTLTMAGDSVIQMRRDTLSDGSVNAVCALTLQAIVQGPETEHVVMREGTIRYMWWEGGDEITTVRLDPQELNRFWVDSIIPGGQSRYSQPQGFGQSEPGARLVRGSAQFTYGFSNADTTVTTAPYNFYCY